MMLNGEKSGISMLFGALPWQQVSLECVSCARIYKQGPIPAICNTSKNSIFYQHTRPKSGLKFPRP